MSVRWHLDLKMAPKKETGVENRLLLGRPGNNLKMGIVGMPNVGKSLLFNLLSKLNVPSENYSFCTIDPTKARIPVPDERFDLLCKHFLPASEVQAFLTVFDIAGLVKGAHEGAGLGNAFLSHIAATDGIFHVVRAFKDKKIEHFEGSVDPVRDLETISRELVYKDMERVENLVKEYTKMLDRGMDKTKQFDLDLSKKVLEQLKEFQEIRNGDWNTKEIEWLNQQNFLTAKPVVYLVNISEKDYMKQKNKFLKDIKEWVNKKEGKKNAVVVPFSAIFEHRMEETPDLIVKPDGVDTIPPSIIPKIITSGYKCLDLINFFTCGADEVRAWTIRDGTKARKAAGVIHGDFEKGFQSADVCSYADFIEYGNLEEAKKNGRLRMQGRDYICEDGDIMHFKINASKKK